MTVLERPRLRCASGSRPHPLAHKRGAVPRRLHTRVQYSERLRFSAQASTQTKTEYNVDVAEIGRVAGATALETCAIAATLYVLQQFMTASVFPANEVFQKGFVWATFFGLSFRSRLFGMLPAPRPRDASRSGDNKGKGFDDRKRPDWCPPGPVFGIVWSSIAVLRATSALLVWGACGHNLVAAPLIIFAAHLSIGDSWNYITNVQAKLGWSAAWNSLLVLPSAVLLDRVYFETCSKAGLLLLPMVVWLLVANALVWGIWDLNGRQKLLPTLKADA